MEKKLFIYKTICLTNGNYYIGQHKGHEDDDYLGSGLALRGAIKKHGEKNFKREILAYANDPVELDLLEAKFVGDKEVNDAKCFNLIPGGGYLIQYGQWSNVFKFLHSDTKKMLSPTNYCFKVKKTPIDRFSFSRPGVFPRDDIKTPSSFFDEKFTNDKKFEKFLKRFFLIKNIVIDDYTISFTEDDVPEKSKTRFHYFVKEIIHDFNSLNSTSIPALSITKEETIKKNKERELKMKSIKELEQKIEKAIIETLSSYRQIKDILEDTDYPPEEKIQRVLRSMKRFRMAIQDEFNFISEGKPVDDLVFDGKYDLTENLEELKLRILHNIMNPTSNSELMTPDDWSLFDNI